MSAIVRRRLAYVVLGHLALHAAVCFASRPLLCLFPLVQAEQSLLYIWSVLRTGNWRHRLPPIYFAAASAWAFAAILHGMPVEASLGVSFILSIVLLPIHVAPLAIVRSGGYRLQQFCQDDIPSSKPFQVSLRTILLSTLVVACLLAFGASIDSGVVMRAYETIGTSAISTALMFVGLPTLFTASALLSVWAALSPGEPISRLAVGLTVVAAGGAFLPYCHKGDARAYAYWCGLTVSLFLIISISLLAFRGPGIDLFGGTRSMTTCLRKTRFHWKLKADKVPVTQRFRRLRSPCNSPFDRF